MIDEKKIEEAARDYINENGSFIKYDEDPCVDIEFAYRKGAKWAINEFLKDLWHPANEEPNKGKIILMEMRNGDIYAQYFVDDKYSWERICTMFTTTSWLYIDDLHTKKGGENERT